MIKETLMKKWALCYKIDHKVKGEGFSAKVELAGTLLAVQEIEGYVWVDGVRPGAIGDAGANIVEACMNFEITIKEVLEDIAYDVDFKKFKEQLDDFFHTEDKFISGQWKEIYDRGKQEDLTEEVLPLAFFQQIKDFEINFNVSEISYD